MNFSITAEELAQYKHINFSVGLDLPQGDRTRPLRANAGW